MIKITADEEGNVSIGIDDSAVSSKIFAEFGCIALAFMRTMADLGISDVPLRTINMVALASQQLHK